MHYEEERDVPVFWDRNGKVIDRNCFYCGTVKKYSPINKTFKVVCNCESIKDHNYTKKE